MAPEDGSLNSAPIPEQSDIRATELAVQSLRSSLSEGVENAEDVVDELAGDVLHDIEELRVAAGLAPKDVEINVLLSKEESADSDEKLGALAEEMLTWVEAALKEIRDKESA